MAIRKNAAITQGISSKAALLAIEVRWLIPFDLAAG